MRTEGNRSSEMDSFPIHALIPSSPVVFVTTRTVSASLLLLPFYFPCSVTLNNHPFKEHSFAHRRTKIAQTTFAASNPSTARTIVEMDRTETN